MKKLKTILESIEEQRKFPTYLSWGAVLTFFGYAVSALMNFFWIIDFHRTNMEGWIPFTFFISTILFLLLGIVSIKDISQTMKREFEYLKEKVEQAKSRANLSVKI